MTYFIICFVLLPILIVFSGNKSHKRMITRLETLYTRQRSKLNLMATLSRFDIEFDPVQVNNLKMRHMMEKHFTRTFE